MFDFLLHDYPNAPPKAKFLTTACGRVRFNPNLYACGKVCLSLLGTWSGPGWQRNQSTLLQVLISIQGLILVPDPYYNEPGFAPGKMKAESDRYTMNIRRYTVEHAISGAIRAVLSSSPSSKAKPGARTYPYPEFEDIVFQHFRHRVTAIETQLQAWFSEDGTIESRVEEARGLLGVLARAGNLPAARAAYAKFALKTPKPRHETDRAAARSLFFPPPTLPFSSSVDAADLPLPWASTASMVGAPAYLTAKLKSAPPLLAPPPGALANLPPSSIDSFSGTTGMVSNVATRLESRLSRYSRTHRGSHYSALLCDSSTSSGNEPESAGSSPVVADANVISSTASAALAAMEGPYATGTTAEATCSAASPAEAVQEGKVPLPSSISRRASRYLRRSGDSLAQSTARGMNSPGHHSEDGIPRRFKKRRSSPTLKTAATATADPLNAVHPALNLKKPPPGSLGSI
jgi:hypothetical protein